ncbi:MAG: hypothetical protein ACK46Q_14205 [Hyphomonas sp.]
MANAVIGALRVNLGLDSAQFSKGLKQSQSALQKCGKRMAVVGAGISAAGAGIALAMRGQMNAADDMGKLAQKIGIPVDELSRLKHAADMSGVSMGSVQTAVMRLSRAMAATPDKFNKIGVSVRDVNGAMRPTSEVMADVAQVLSGMPDGAEKTALAMEYLGRSGADLIPMMNGGRDALKGMFDEADDLGIVISPEMAKNAELFNDNISRLTKQFSGLWTMIAANLAPALVRISDVLVSVAARFRNMSPALQAVISGLAGAVVVLGPVLSGLGLMIMGAAPFVGAMAKVALAIRGVSMALLANPIGLAVAAIAGAAYLITQEWDTVGPWFSDMWANVKQIFGGFADFVGGIFTGDLGGALDGLKAAWEGLKAYYQTLWDGITGIFTYAWENGIKPVTDALGMTEGIETGWQRLQTVFDTVLSAISTAFSTAWRVIEPIYDALNWVWDHAAELGSRISGLGGGSTGTTAPDWADVIAPPVAPAAPTGDMQRGLAGGTAGIRVQGASDADAYGTGFEDAMGIRSPSKRMIAYGAFMSQGLGLGIASGQTHVEAATARVGQSMFDGMQPYFTGVFTEARRLSDVFDTLRSGFANMLSDMSSRLLQSGLSGLFGGLLGAFDPLAGALRGAGLPAVPSFANGVSDFSGGLARINEYAKGELVALPDGSTVFPHDISRRMADSAAAGSAAAASINVTVSGARGNAEVQEMVASGVRQGLQRYDRDVLPDSVLRVSADNNQRYGNT